MARLVPDVAGNRLKLPHLMHGDVQSAARALAAVPRLRRAWVMHRMLAEAATADAWRRAHGQMHPRWGDGSLMAAALRRPVIKEPPLSDPAWCRLMAFAYLAIAHAYEGMLPLDRDGAA